MKKYFYKILCLFVASCSALCFTGCKKPTVTYPGLDASTKSYYSKNGYVSFSVTSDLKVTSDVEEGILYFNDGTAMIKDKSNLEVKPADDNYVLTDFGFYINFKEKKVLSKIDINGKLYSYIDKDFNKYAVSGALTLKATINTFDIVGVMCLIDKSYVVEDKDISLKDILTSSDSIYLKNDYKTKYSIYYSYLSQYNNFEVVSNNKFKSNVVFNCKKNDDNTNVNFTYELFFNKSVTTTFIVVKDSEGRLFIQEMEYDSTERCYIFNNESTEENKIEKFTLSFSNDLNSKSSF